MKRIATVLAGFAILSLVTGPAQAGLGPGTCPGPCQPILLAAATVTPGANAEEMSARCLLQLIDDRGIHVEESVTVCRTDHVEGKPDACFDMEPGAPPPEIDVATLRIEGAGHGPVTAKPEDAADGTCSIVVRRKAAVTISFNSNKTRGLEASFYRTDEDPELFRPAHQISVEHETTIRVPAGPYVLSLTDRGWAPDLHLLDAVPGSSNAIRHHRRDGWSVVLRAVADGDETPVADADIEVRTLPGFDEEPRPGGAKTRILLKRQTNESGFAVASGLHVPVAAATMRHKRFLESKIPAFSSDAGSFRVFTARLREGGSLAVRVVQETQGAANARCELAPPERSSTQPWGLREAIYETRADQDGICKATRIPAGRYALKVSLPDNVDAYTIQPIVVRDGETSDPTVELRPIVLTGRVLQGGKGAIGYEITFERDGPYEVNARYPASQATTDDDGNYEMTLWTPGEYLGHVSTESTTAGNFQHIELYGDETVDFRIAEAELEGQVVDDSGEPRPEARLTIKSPGLQRAVTLDEEARFRISFRDESGSVEIQAVADGFHRSKPAVFMLDKDQKPEPVILVIRQRKWRAGRFALPSGQPAAGITVSVHRLELASHPYALERLTTDADGNVEIPLVPGPVRLFHGGPGCALGSFDLAPIATTESFEADDPPFEVRCEPPSNLMVRLRTDDPELRGRAPILLRHDGGVIPPSVLEHHLLSLGLPATTDGQGQIGLVALAPGTYDLFHGISTSYRNLLRHHEKARLTSVTLGFNATMEIEVTLDFALNKFKFDFGANQ